MTRRALIALSAVAVVCWTALGEAQLKTTGSGKDRVMDGAQFSGKRADQFKLFKSRCTSCHDANRTIKALETGVGPVTNAKFDKEGTKSYVVALMRKPNSGLTKEEAPEILDFLEYVRELAKKKSGSEVIPFGPGMEKPKKKSGPDPAYNRAAREAKIEGKLLAQCVVSTEGKLSDCKILKGLPFLDEVVLDVLPKQVWQPATRDGKPIAVLFTIPFTFKLDKT